MERVTTAGRRMLLGVLLSTGLLGCDLGTKELAVEHLRGAAPVSVWGEWLMLRYAENRDVGFALLRWLDESVRYSLLLTLIPVVVGGVAVWWWRRRSEATALEHAAYGAVIAGALGNLIDRVTRGFVVDFIAVPHYPVFNVADIAVFLGAVGLFIGMRRSSPEADPSI